MTVRRTSVAQAVLLVGVTLGNAWAGEAREQPSILIVMPDQWRAQALGCMDNLEVRTPHFDRLASQGILFRNTFANTPVCCPARAVILTGQYAHTNGMVANDLRLRSEVVTLAEILAEQGYRTGFIGKWHLDGGPRQPGFVPPGERRQGFDFWAAHECSHAHFNPTYFRDGPEPFRDDRFEPEVWTDLAIEFLRGVGDAPFFLEVAMGPPHDPYKAPDIYRGLYDADALTMRLNWQPGVSGGDREAIASYYAMITAVDEQFGRLMAALEESGRADDTIVLVTSDHGDMLGSHGKRLKRKPWEESIRVPGILRWPGRIEAGRETDALLSHVDLAPTLLALAGLPVPEFMQGSDLSRVALGEADDGPGFVYFQIFVPFDGGGLEYPWRGVRTRRHMYARTEQGPWVLYDLERDPYELENLADSPRDDIARAELESRLAEWMEETGDSWELNSMIRVEDQARLYRHRAFTTIAEYLEWVAEHPELTPKDNPSP